MKLLIMLLIEIMLVIFIFWCAGCSTKLQPARPVENAFVGIEGAVEEIEATFPSISSEQVVDKLRAACAQIRSFLATAKVNLKIIQEENEVLTNQNAVLRRMNTADWISCGVVVALSLFLAVKLNKHLAWFALAPVIGIILKTLIGSALVVLPMIMLGLGIVAVLIALFWVLKATGGIVWSIEKLKSVLPHDIREKWFGQEGDKGIMGKIQPTASQNLVKTLKNKQTM